MVCGLPRCRTAWFSVLTSTPKSICHHEPVAITSSFDALVEIWQPKCGISVGMSDSTLTLQLDRIMDAVKPRTLMIDRPLDEVERSLERYMEGAGHAINAEAGRNYLLSLAAKMDEFRDHPLIKTVQFSELESRSVLLECLDWILPGMEFPDLDHLMKMNIQVRRDYVINQLKQSRVLWYMS